jgi:hypothetical protein
MRKLRGADSSEHHGVTVGALTSPGDPAPVDQGGTAEGSEGLPRVGNQATLGAAYVRFSDLETDRSATYDVLFEDRGPVERFSLPVSFEQGVGPVALDSVTVDRLPSLRGYAMQNDDYSGLGFTAQSVGDRLSDACPESYPAEPYYEHDVQRGSSDSWWVRGRQTPVSFPNGASGICTPSLKTAGRAAQWGAAVIFNRGDEGCDSRLDFNLRRSGGPNHGQYLPSGFRGYAFGDETTAANTTVDITGQAEGTYHDPFGNRLCAPLQIRQVLLLNRLRKLPPVRAR